MTKLAISGELNVEFVKEGFDINTTDRNVLEFNDTGAVPIELFAETRGTMSEERRSLKCADN